MGLVRGCFEGRGMKVGCRGFVYVDVLFIGCLGRRVVFLWV